MYTVPICTYSTCIHPNTLVVYVQVYECRTINTVGIQARIFHFLHCAQRVDCTSSLALHVYIYQPSLLKNLHMYMCQVMVCPDQLLPEVCLTG